MQSIIFALGLLAQDAAVQPVEAAEASQVEEVAESRPVSQKALDLFGQLPGTIAELNSQRGQVSFVSMPLTLVGREDLRRGFGIVGPSICLAAHSGSVEDVVAAAQRSQVVIVSEDPLREPERHRAFIGMLASALSDEFDVYASTLFNPLRMDPAHRGARGPYDDEPMFARIIAAADASGYQLVSVAQRSDQRDPAVTEPTARSNLRRTAIVDNLMDQVLDLNPQARVLLHVSTTDAIERGPDEPEPNAEMGEFLGETDAPVADLRNGPIAWQIQQRTGINPLVIQQGCEIRPSAFRGVPGFEGIELGDDPEYAEDEPGWPGELSELRSPLSFAPADFSISYADLRFSDSRPNWRRAIGDVDVAVPEALLPEDRRVILEARAPGRSIETMPIERLLVYPGETLPLLLPPGEWVITAWTIDGAYGEPVTLSVPAP